MTELLNIDQKDVERLLRWAQLFPETYWDNQDSLLAKRLRTYYSTGKIPQPESTDDEDTGDEEASPTGPKVYVGQIWQKTDKTRNEAQVNALDSEYAYLYWVDTNRQTRVKRERLRGKHHWRLVK